MSLGNKEIFSKNLKYYMEKHGVTRKDLVNQLDFAYMTVSDWINAKTYPRIDRIEVLAHYFQIDKSNLIEEQSNKSLIDKINNILIDLEEKRQNKIYDLAKLELDEQNKFIQVKEDFQEIIYHSKLSAGTGYIELDPEYLKTINYKGHIPKHDYAFLVDGDSMMPLFEDGEVVFVEETPDIHNGQIIAVQINGEAFIKKAYKENNHLRLVSLNNQYRDIIAGANDNIQVVGRVIL